MGRDEERAVTLVDVPAQLTIADAAELLYSENPLHLAFTDILVVRWGVSPPDVEDLLEDAQVILRPFWAERAPNASVHLLYVNNYELELTKNCNPSASVNALKEGDHKGFIEYLRGEELKVFISKSSALFHSKENFVYRSPSGDYCSAFLRVGNVQMGKYQLDSFAFWLIPYLKGIEAVVTDTWSISSLTLNVLRLQPRHDPTLTEPLDMDMLSCYQDGTPDVAKETDEVLIRISQNGQKKVLFILSTVMTGESITKLRGEIRQLGLREDKFEFLALYKLNDQCQIPCLCDLSNGLDEQNFVSMKLLPDNTTVVEIDPHTYFPLHIEETLVELGKVPEVKSCIDETKDFVDAYQGCGVISVHRNATDLNKQKLRHHAIYIDVCEMLAKQRFKDRLEAVLIGYDAPPKAIVMPPHEAGLALANEVSSFINRRFGAPPRQIVHADLLPDAADVPVEFFKSCDVNDVIIILDDVSATGIRLSRYQAHLRDCYKGRIDYIVGVARPESMLAWKRRERDLKYRVGGAQNGWHRIKALETIILPDWSEKDCTWCQELQLLEDISQNKDVISNADLSKHLNDRRRVLVNAQSAAGISSDAFWCHKDGKRSTLTDNSIFLAMLTQRMQTFMQRLLQPCNIFEN